MAWRRTIDAWVFSVLVITGFVSQSVWGATPAALQISAETAPAGGWAQIKVYAAKPTAIASGHLVLNLDATAFGTGPMVGLFGANGDAAGLATVTWPQIDVQFSSPTGGIGQLPGLPVLVISAPVLASAAGRTVAVTATSPDSSVSVAGGSVTVRGTLSVDKIPAGMGVVAAGTVVPVYGTGFTASTVVAIDGVDIASTSFVSAAEIDVTIAGATELVGKHARVVDGEAAFDYFCFQPSDPVNFPESSYLGSAVVNVQPLFPLLALTGFTGYTSETGGVVEIQNPNPSPATVNFTRINLFSRSNQGETALSIPTGSWAIFDGTYDSSFVGNSDLPVRVVPMSFCGAGVGLPVCLTPSTPYNAATLGPAAPVLAPSSLAFGWQMGSSTLPPTRTISVSAANPTAAAASGGSWLLVSMQGGRSPTFSVSANPSQLTVGTYQGSVVVTQSYGPSAILPVSLTVTDTPVPVMSSSPSSLSFRATAFNAAPYSQTISVKSDSGPTAFSVTLQPGSWLKVSPMSGTTPATLTVTWDPAVTSQIYYQQRLTPASIFISGPLGNTITVPATFNVTGVQTFQTSLGESGTGPAGLIFSAQTGSTSQMQTIFVDPAGTISAIPDQPWMSVVAPTVGVNANQTVVVTVNPAGLEAGVYKGTVTIGEAGLDSIAVPVTLGVWSSAPPLTVTTGSFTFIETVGEPVPAYQNAEVDSGGVPVPLQILNGYSGWLNVVTYPYSAPTPSPIRVGIVNVPQSPGEYDGSFTVQSPSNSVSVPVTLLIEPNPLASPVLSQVVNAASGVAGSVSPGEILSIRGYSAGASAVSGLKLDASGTVVSSLNGLQVMFDGRAAPLIYTSANQTNVIVPYEVAGKRSTMLQVVYTTAAGRLQTAAWAVPVVEAAPGVFTLDGTGAGQAAALNQDGSVNSATNPAAPGSVISIYATGEGQTSPAGVTGSVSQSNIKSPLLPVTVRIGGIEASVQYAGSAAGEVAGVLQVNAVIPQGLLPGTAPVAVSVGGIASQARVTIAVK